MTDGTEYVGMVIAPPAPRKPAEKPKRKPGSTKGRFQSLRRFWLNPQTVSLSHAEQSTWLYLWFLADPGGRCHPSIGRIGARLGCDRRYARRLVAGLRAKRFLSVVERGTSRNRRANVYKLRVPQGGDDEGL